MSVYDYIVDMDISARIQRRARAIHNHDESRWFIRETYLELYDFCPFDRGEINAIIERVYRKYKPQDGADD